MAVPDIVFHSNVQDRLTYTCRLLRKAIRQGNTIGVTGSVEMLSQFDLYLWRFCETDFVPHCMSNAPPRVLSKTKIVLSPTLASLPFQQNVVNLGDDVPQGFEQFERVIEIVGMDDHDKHLARLRWKRYSALGFVPIAHNTQTTP
jgi:DNA polymerase III subunit chi